MTLSWPFSEIACFTFTKSMGKDVGFLAMSNHCCSNLCLSHIQPRALYDFYHLYDFLSVRPSEAPVWNLRWYRSPGYIRLRAPYRAGVKYVLSNTNTNTNTKIWIFQIQIQIFCSSLIQIQIQIHRFKYKYVQPNISAENCSDPK